MAFSCFQRPQGKNGRIFAGENDSPPIVMLPLSPDRRKSGVHKHRRRFQTDCHDTGFLHRRGPLPLIASKSHFYCQPPALHWQQNSLKHHFGIRRFRSLYIMSLIQRISAGELHAIEQDAVNLHGCQLTDQTGQIALHRFRIGVCPWFAAFIRAVVQPERAGPLVVCRATLPNGGQRVTGSTAPAQSQTSHCHESFESLVQNSNKPPLRRPLPSPAPMRREKATCRQYPLRQSLQRMHRSALQQQGSYLGQMHCEASSPAARAPQLLFAAALQAPLTAAPAAHPILARHCLFPPEAAW